MKLLCLDIPKPGATMEQYRPHLMDEVRYGWKLYKDGPVREIYFRKDRPGVAIIAECDSVEATRQILSEFPLAKVGLIEWEVIPLGPFQNWEMLFAPHDA